MKTKLIFLLLAAPALAALPPPAFDHYEIILTRKPFGELLAPIATPPPPPPPNEIPKHYRLCSIVQENDGSIKVGILDLRTQKGLTLIPGGPAEAGLQVNRASYEDGTAELRLGDEIQQLTLTGIATAITAPRSALLITPAAPPPATPLRVGQRPAALAPTATPAAPSPNYTGAELHEHLEKYKMEVIRQGLPPLPIPLTNQQDDQLVTEGLLPAR